MLKALGAVACIFLFMIVLFCAYVWSVAEVSPPAIADTAALSLEKRHIEGSLYVIDNNWIRKNKWGLYEMYVSGAPFEMGIKEGKLSRQEIVDQEIAFTDEIKRMVPSPAYLRFLKYIVGFMNRDLASHIKEEYKEEIYGISHAASDSFNWIGSGYTRLLNYHAAHDIGHALQNMMLVGCTSFGAWEDKTENGSMLIGRNFDFWVGDKFAENKIVSFYRPQSGYAFVSVTWGGFTGVVSGMNDKGLTVTINAARSDIPFGAATPVSLVAREVLQYAATTKEAVEIAKRRKMFVSESFLVGSALEHKAVIIEKTPSELAVYDPAKDFIRCTNHYQSKIFENQKLNREQKENSASVYRYQRLQELMTENYPLNPVKMAAVLRDRKGLNGEDIGNGNEKAINQLIAHHSIIFQPDSLRFWISTNPWQLGTYVCYDLKNIFGMNGLHQDHEIADTLLNIPPDRFLNSPEYRQFLNFRKNKMALLHHQPVDTGEVVRSNPRFYDAYRIAGDFCMENKWYRDAMNYYSKALRLEIATVDERESLQHKISHCRKKLNP